MKIFGITGGTGAGKTTTLTVLSEMDMAILDCDVIYHELICTSTTLQEALTDRFGNVFNHAGLDRKKLGAVVFQNPEALTELNNITMHFIEDEVHRRIFTAKDEGRPGVAIDAVGLLESRVKYECDALVAVLAPEEIRVRRIMEREGITEEYARNRINAQRSEEYFRKHCKYILENNGTESDFRKKIYELFSRLLAE